jgi:tripartite-type tricarboxylate transporter receptor subunit TctC
MSTRRMARPNAVRTRAAARLVALATVMLAAANGTAWAQAFPAKTVRVVVPFAPGGSLDMLGRTVAARLTPRLGQQVVVENVAGAGGNLGTVQVARAAADGYTLLLAGDNIPINIGLYRTPGYTLKSFAGITLAIESPQVLVVHPSVPAHSVRELVELAKTRARPLNMASPGSGSPGHLAGELFKSMAGIEMTHVPYKGGGPAVTDLLAGHVDLLFVTLPAAAGHMRAGKLRALGMSTANRSTAFPEIATIAESGVAGYAVSSWQGFLAPAGTPREIVLRLHREIADVLRSAEVRDQLVRQGFEVVASTPEALDAIVASAAETWGRVIRASGAKVDE